MSPPFKTIALFGKQQSDGTAQTLGEIGAFLDQRGLRVLFEAGIAGTLGLGALPTADIHEIGESADLAVIVGGDGTMLGIARELAPHGVPLVGINHGRLGFITDIPLLQWSDALGAVLDGHYEAEDRSILQARVTRDGSVVFEASAVNDVVVSRSSRAGMIDVQVHVDGLYMYSQRADGLIVATPTGSTAYALSCAGPILHPSLDGLVLVPVAPQALSNRPIVLPSSSVISMSVADGREPRLNCDMQTFVDLQIGDVIEVRRAPYSARFLHPSGYSYYATLRSKLNWHEMPSLAPRS
ncbi:MAG: NAD kinase [Burkholderiales bacterium]|nr:MAG: NAD kinase [Burkholderiales bacterium]